MLKLGGKSQKCKELNSQKSQPKSSKDALGHQTFYNESIRAPDQETLIILSRVSLYERIRREYTYIGPPWAPSCKRFHTALFNMGNNDKAGFPKYL